MRKLATAAAVALGAWLTLAGVASAASAASVPQVQTRTKIASSTFDCSSWRTGFRQLFAAHPEKKAEFPQAASWAADTRPGMDTCQVVNKVTITTRTTTQNGVASALGMTSALAWDGQQHVEAYQSVAGPGGILASTAHVSADVNFAAGCCTEGVGSPHCWIDNAPGFSSGVDNCEWEYQNAGTCCTGAANFWHLNPIPLPFLPRYWWIKVWCDSTGNFWSEASG